MAAACGAPLGYNYFVKAREDAPLLRRLMNNFSMTGEYHDRCSNTGAAYGCPRSGKLGDVEVCVLYQSDLGSYQLWFRDQEAYISLCSTMSSQEQEREEALKYPLYRWEQQFGFWKLDKHYMPRARVNYVGYS